MRLLSLFFFLIILAAGCERPEDKIEYSFGAEKKYETHREIEIRWENEGVFLSGTLYLPLDSGFYSTAVWVHGSSLNLRKPYRYEHHELVRHGSACTWTERGFAFFSYDKRGTGKSEGVYITDVANEAHLKQLGRDALSAIKICANHPEINIQRIGLFGESQAGWIIPTIFDKEKVISFNIIINGPVITYGEFDFYAQQTGNNETEFGNTDCENINLDSIYDVLNRNREKGVQYSGYNPTSDLLQLETPTLFIYGLRDLHIPSVLCINDLNDIKNKFDKDWQILTYENADHALITENGTCLTKQEIPLTRGVHYQVDWETPTFTWLNDKSESN